MIHQVTAFTHCHLLIILYPKMKQFAISIKFIGIITIRKSTNCYVNLKRLSFLLKSTIFHQSIGTKRLLTQYMIQTKINSQQQLFAAQPSHQPSNNQQSTDTCMKDCALPCEEEKKLAEQHSNSRGKKMKYIERQNWNTNGK